MAKKTVYLYRVTMGYGDSDKEVAFCYARNAGCAVDGTKEIFKEKKYDCYRAKMFGETDIRIHPKPFEPMSMEEVEYINKNGIGAAEAYAQRKQAIPSGGQMIAPEDLDKVLNEQE